MLALHSIGARPCSAAGGLNARPMTHLAAGATHTMTPIGQQGHGNVLGGMPLAGSPTHGAGNGFKYGIRPHGDRPSAIRKLASQVDDAAPENSPAGGESAGEEPSSRCEPAHITKGNALARMKSV
jgi:hypothetical protein